MPKRTIEETILLSPLISSARILEFPITKHQCTVLAQTFGQLPNHERGFAYELITHLDPIRLSHIAAEDLPTSPLFELDLPSDKLDRLLAHVNQLLSQSNIAHADILRMCKIVSAPTGVLVAILVYLERTDQHRLALALQDRSSKCLLLGFLVVATKYHCDESHSNRTICDSLSNLDVLALCQLEITCCQLLNYSFDVSPIEFYSRIVQL